MFFVPYFNCSILPLYYMGKDHLHHLYIPIRNYVRGNLYYHPGISYQLLYTDLCFLNKTLVLSHTCTHTHTQIRLRRVSTLRKEIVYETNFRDFREF